jgi:hypothetical protein
VKTENVLKVIDLKTGSGVKVYARNNGQLLIYALLARLEWAAIFGPFHWIELHIVQSALDHIDVYTLSSAELDAFEQELLTTVARIKSGDRRAAPGETQCRFCRARAVCRARAEHNRAVMKADFAAPAALSISEIAVLLPQLAQIESWCGAVRDHALAEALKGVVVPDHKLVAGKSNRVWRNEPEAADALAAYGIATDQLWKKKLIGITAAEDLLGKSHRIFAEQTVKPQGKPTLVPENNPRPALPKPEGDFTAV